MSEQPYVLKVEVTPTPANKRNIAAAQQRLVANIKGAVQKRGDEQLLNEQRIKIEPLKGFPTDPVMVVFVTFLTQIALESYKEMLRREGNRMGEAKVERIAAHVDEADPSEAARAMKDEGPQPS